MAGEGLPRGASGGNGGAPTRVRAAACSTRASLPSPGVTMNFSSNQATGAFGGNGAGGGSPGGGTGRKRHARRSRPHGGRGRRQRRRRQWRQRRRKRHRNWGRGLRREHWHFYPQAPARREEGIEAGQRHRRHHGQPGQCGLAREVRASLAARQLGPAAPRPASRATRRREATARSTPSASGLAAASPSSAPPSSTIRRSAATHATTTDPDVDGTFSS